eukprot:CAMPEP_0202895358 /NCGR_PEP_ID=MMETSP1392-20130828/4583_1 /ASSEMBLY_ACC=CAM_ASM_000868 /TAXON_ID=225041 /ORGANISM="Chlamydomonas chlamydogama, Strain SAG 11-48b" /LENGTH=882 /DNA_ID=CAMNT_0049580345 /DNA_START=176 /DNA_END=2821 /DNA_ORIENTATION=-
MVHGSRVAPENATHMHQITPWGQQDYTLKGPLAFRTKEKVQCLCEGGGYCWRENPAKQKEPNAIPGLHSSWVGDKVLAMARPWQDYVVKFNLVDAFVHHNIGMILNLQEVGEHDSCGPGNLKHTGFSYDPESFMAARIGFYNFSWRDMGVPDLDRMMDIVQVMDYVTLVEGRKIAVHCHAGLGRTGLAIACFFVFTKLYTAKTAVQTVRHFRPGALQTSSQVMFVAVFEQYLAYLRCVFRGKEVSSIQQLAALAGSQGAAAQQQLQLPSAQEQQAAAAAAKGKWQAPNQGETTTGLQPPKQVWEAAGARHELYHSGLTIVRPLHGPTRDSGRPAAGGEHHNPKAEITDHALGLDRKLPWDEHFHIQTSSFTPDWQPEPPHSYAEALHRQQRLLHGPDRRTFLHLHRFLKEAVFSIIGAALSFDRVAAATAMTPLGQPGPGPSSTAAAAAAGAGNQHPYQQQQQQQPGQAGAPPAHNSGAGQRDPPWRSFAHAVAACINRGARLDPPTVAMLATKPGYGRFVGPVGDLKAVEASALYIKKVVNLHEYAVLATAPVLPLLMAIEEFFKTFEPQLPSLTPTGLQWIDKVYTQLPFEVTPGGELAAMQQCADLLRALPPQDQELLLLFAALMRHCVRASGPGCEAAIVEIGRWAVSLLLGKLAQKPAAIEAVLSMLWWLVRFQPAYGAAILMRRTNRGPMQLQTQLFKQQPDIPGLVASPTHQAPPSNALPPPQQQQHAIATPQAPWPTLAPAPALPPQQQQQVQLAAAPAAAHQAAPALQAPDSAVMPPPPLPLPGLGAAAAVAEDSTRGPPRSASKRTDLPPLSKFGMSDTAGAALMPAARPRSGSLPPLKPPSIPRHSDLNGLPPTVVIPPQPATTAVVHDVW